MTPNEVSDVVEEIKVAASSRAAAELFIEFGRKNGACHATTFFGSYDDEQFIKTYPDTFYRFGKGSSEPLRLHMARDVISGRKPVVCWGLDLSFDFQEVTAEGIQLMHELDDHFEVRTACTFPMPDKDGAFRGAGLGLHFDDRSRAFEKRMRGYGSAFGIVAFSAFAKMCLLRDNDPRDNPLSPRQRDVLLHLSQGKQISAIADSLGVSDSAINLYLRNAKAKLGARTREQALAQAIINGWIQP